VAVITESPENRYHPLQVQRKSAVKDLKPLITVGAANRI
jgi:hypothetical protein